LQPQRSLCFVNTTPLSTISTLSLHDALPICLALGARRITVLKMVLRDAAVLLLTGIAIGLTATVASASLLRTMLYGTGSRNPQVDRKSTRLNSSHGSISYAVFCFKQKNVIG